MMSKWHVWTINSNRIKKVQEFIKTLDEIESYLYPMVEKQKEGKKSKKKEYVPLYNNYIFLKYTDDIELNYQLENFPWITGYVGVCSEKEMEAVKDQSRKKYEDLVPMNKIEEGHAYKLVGTPFRGFTCIVVANEGERIKVSVEIFGAERHVYCSPDDIELEGR